MITLDSISLPSDLSWIDEFSWTPVRQSQQVSLSGALVVEEAVQQAGRLITLAGGDEVWTTHATVEALYALAQQASTPLALNYHGRSFDVLFHHQNGAIDAQPVYAHENPTADAPYTLTLRLIEV